MRDAAKLRAPFPPEQIGKLPKTAKRPELDYVGHAHVTDRLNDAAPGWEFQVLERFEAGGDCWVLGRMTIDGVSRDDYGDGSDPKGAIGNAIRRCAMRWGVALDLWIKEEASDSGRSTRSTTVPVSDPTSEGEGNEYGEGSTSLSSDDSLDAVVRAYGSSAKAMLAARKLWPDTTSVAQLTQEQRATLIEAAT